MSDTNDMRAMFEMLLLARGASTICKGDGYGDSLSQSFWVFWQVATKSATALERERCAIACQDEQVESNDTDGDVAYNLAIAHCVNAIRQGGDT